MLLLDDPFQVEIAHPSYKWYKQAVRGTVLYRRTEDEFQNLNMLLAHENEDPLGFLAYSIRGSELSVDQVRSKKSGVGSALLDACDVLAQQFSMRTQVLRAPPKLMEFYQMHGFEPESDVVSSEDLYIAMYR